MIWVCLLEIFMDGGGCYNRFVGECVWVGGGGGEWFGTKSKIYSRAGCIVCAKVHAVESRL